MHSVDRDWNLNFFQSTQIHAKIIPSFQSNFIFYGHSKIPQKPSVTHSYPETKYDALRLLRDLNVPPFQSQRANMFQTKMKHILCWPTLCQTFHKSCQFSIIIGIVLVGRQTSLVYINILQNIVLNIAAHSACFHDIQFTETENQFIVK